MIDFAKELERITALLREQSTVALATSGEDGEACVAPLFYICDERLALYWLSSETSRHSVNLKRTPAAAATVFRDVDRWKEIRGVQMRGTVTIVSDRKRRGALVKAYCERFQLGTIFRLAISQSTLYEFQPDFLRYIDNSTGFGARVELDRSESGGWIAHRD